MGLFDSIGDAVGDIFGGGIGNVLGLGGLGLGVGATAASFFDDSTAEAFERARQENDRRYQLAIDELNAARPRLRDTYTQLLSRAERATGQVLGDLREGERAVSNVYRQAYEDLDRRGREAAAASEQQLAGLGLSRSTIGTDARRAVAESTADSARRLAADEGRFRYETASNRARTRAGLLSDERATLERGGQSDFDVSSTLASAYLSRQDVARDTGNRYEPLGQLGGTLLGLAGSYGQDRRDRERLGGLFR